MSAAGEEVEHADVADVGVAVVQLDGHAPRGLLDVEVQHVAGLLGDGPVGVGHAHRLGVAQAVLAEANGVGLLGLALATADRTVAAVNGELDQLKGFAYPYIPDERELSGRWVVVWGGSWDDVGAFATCTARGTNMTDFRSRYLGFRVACDGDS